MGITGFHHSSFTVSDMDRALAFYRDLLGLTVVVDRIVEEPYVSQLTGFPDVKLRIAFLQVNPPHGHILELAEYQSHPGQRQDLRTNCPGVGHVCLLVDDMAGLYEKLRAEGTPLVSPPVQVTSGVNEGGYAVYLRDPDGSPIELLQPPRKTVRQERSVG